jgi:hypothetical protein
MALLGKAAVVIWVDMDAGMLGQHDVWHSAEHLPERMGVPGFLRGRRCAAVDPGAQPRFVLYELEDIAVSTSAPYLERLNNPTHWSQRVMANCRLSRTLCRVVASHGEGVGAGMLTIRLAPRPGEERALQSWLVDEALPELAKREGIVGAHLLQKDAATVKPLTSEEKLRRGGADASADWVILVEAFSAALAAGAAAELPSQLGRKGAADGTIAAAYTVSHLMTSLHHR